MALSMFTGGFLGTLAHTWWQKKSKPAKHRIPRQWPLDERPLVNPLEQHVWHWLIKSFLDHHVMVKVPVTRFTKPQTRDVGPEMLRLLDGIYCTFTVCGADGHVIGCVDVPGPSGLSLGNQTLKHSLLSQCNIRYWVLDAEQLPSVTEIRTAFLGPKALKQGDLEHALSDARFMQSRAHLQALLSQQRHLAARQAAARAAAAPKPPAAAQMHDSQLSSGWPANSFLAPLDSRMDNEAAATPPTRRVRAGSSPGHGGW